jgi:polysaccharide deacetylase family protein (PEP-CTERM system associated)
MIVNVLTVDVEEYYHAAIFRRGTSTLPGRGFESRVVSSMERLLELLRTHRTRATFFVLGEVAAAHPSLVRALVAEQHEVACHGDRHEDVCRQSPQEFRADIRRAKAEIEAVAGQPVIGYRAPNFSIGRAQSWAYEILAEEGFSYDSSLYPIHHDRYGQPDAPRFPYEIWRKGSASLMEFPIGTARVMGMNFPIGGGGFFRLLPYGMSCRGIRHVNVRERQPVMFYLHPWELDPDQPRAPMDWQNRFRHYVGVGKEAGKLSRLLGQFTFGTAREFLQTRVCRIRVFDSAGDRVSVAAV